MFRTYAEIIEALKQKKGARVMAVAAAQDAPAIEAALHARDAGIARPVFVGDALRIRELLRGMDRNPADFDILQADAGSEAQVAVELVKDGSANLLMKGMLETRDLLRPVVAKENDLRTGALMSHVVFFGEVPRCEKLFIQTDGGMVMYPTLEEKAGIIENAVDTLQRMGYENPKVAALCAIEFVNPKMKESVEAGELQRMNREGIIKNCTVVGPISYDIAMDADIARRKGFDCPYCGAFDVLLVPDMNCGNIMGKCLTVTAGAKMAGIVVGAKAPIVLTSRGSSAEEKFNSIAIAALTAGAMGN
ncbi:MAG TPA: phosphate acyltransferase [Clostridia bacterium]|nr:phosphate acyltransferase [Clostridia bacterium]